MKSTDDALIETQVTFCVVVEALAHATRPLLLSDLATETELSRGQVRGAVGTGCHMGWIAPVQTTGGTAYTLTPRLTELGLSQLTQRASALKTEMEMAGRVIGLLQTVFQTLNPALKG